MGEFIDFSDLAIIRDQFVAAGSDLSGVILGGVRFPVGSQFTVGGELRYEDTTGRVCVDQGFLEERIDLSGFTSQFTFRIRF